MRECSYKEPEKWYPHFYCCIPAMCVLFVLCLALSACCGKPAGTKSGSVRVAAIQSYSEMGDTEGNIERMLRLIREAASRGARIVVTPECAVQVVDTEYGRLGLMICYDFQALPKMLSEANADIVLYSVGWYGPNEKNWFANLFPRDHVVPNEFDIVCANWCGQTVDDDWPGRGHSCVISRRGEVLAMDERTAGEAVVIADIPLERQ